MSSDITGYDDRISRLCKGSADFYAVFDLSHSGRCDKNAVYLSFACNFGITGHDMYACFCGCFFHCGGDFFQFFHREAFFDDKCAGQVQWFCTHTCEVIDRTANGKFTDISARKECR